MFIFRHSFVRSFTHLLFSVAVVSKSTKAPYVRCFTRSLTQHTLNDMCECMRRFGRNIYIKCKCGRAMVKYWIDLDPLFFAGVRNFLNANRQKTSTQASHSFSSSTSFSWNKKANPSASISILEFMISFNDEHGASQDESKRAHAHKTMPC